MRATCPLLIRPRRRPNPKQPAPQPKLRPAAACVRASHSLAPSLAGAPASRGPLRSRQRALACASQVRAMRGMCETLCEASQPSDPETSQPLDQTSDPINRRVPARVSGYFWNLAIFSPSLHIFFILTSRKALVSIVKPGIPHEVPEKPGKFIFSVSKPDLSQSPVSQ